MDDRCARPTPNHAMLLPVTREEMRSRGEEHVGGGRRRRSVSREDGAEAARATGRRADMRRARKRIAGRISTSLGCHADAEVSSCTIFRRCFPTKSRSFCFFPSCFLSCLHFLLRCSRRTPQAYMIFPSARALRGSSLTLRKLLSLLPARPSSRHRHCRRSGYRDERVYRIETPHLSRGERSQPNRGLTRTLAGAAFATWLRGARITSIFDAASIAMFDEFCCSLPRRIIRPSRSGYCGMPKHAAPFR